MWMSWREEVGQLREVGLVEVLRRKAAHLLVRVRGGHRSIAIGMANRQAWAFAAREHRRGVAMQQLVDNRAILFLGEDGYRINDGSERIRGWWQRTKWVLAGLPGLDACVVSDGDPYSPPDTVLLHFNRSRSSSSFARGLVAASLLALAAAGCEDEVAGQIRREADRFEATCEGSCMRQCEWVPYGAEHGACVGSCVAAECSDAGRVAR